MTSHPVWRCWLIRRHRGDAYSFVTSPRSSGMLQEPNTTNCFGTYVYCWAGVLTPTLSRSVHARERITRGSRSSRGHGADKWTGQRAVVARTRQDTGPDNGADAVHRKASECTGVTQTREDGGGGSRQCSYRHWNGLDHSGSHGHEKDWTEVQDTEQEQGKTPEWAGLET